MDRGFPVDAVLLLTGRPPLSGAMPFAPPLAVRKRLRP